MTIHPKIATREEWLKARLDLLEEEKALTRRADELTQQRMELPWVRIDKEYRFDTDSGLATLAGLFRGRSQLLIYHFMFGPDYDAGCPSCSSIADGFNGIVPHLENHDVAFTAVSRAPLAKLQAFKKRMRWSFPWASSSQSDFNFEFNVSYSQEQERSGDVVYNFRREEASAPADDSAGETENEHTWSKRFAAMAGTDRATYGREAPGVSAFALEDGVVYHTYSAFARGVDGLWNLYQWLDRAPRGRNESFDAEPWLRHHDRYATA
ncbi:MAG TPA: thioredoxin family protein [Candidatus Cybelea sp.]|jgi:predicted dithiol-disulfide oxidoreductase (DUF899 family)|nr:thioredoxin family protein [Candidatus Cybelea sp.]